MRQVKFFILLNIFGFVIGLHAQGDSVLVSDELLFKDGIYLDMKSFRNNTPDYTWEELVVNMHINDETLIATINRLWVSKDSTPIDLKRVWGMSFEGLPFIQFRKEEKKFIQLVGLRQIGKISYYSYWQTETEMVSIKAYNPYTGKPFREAKVPKEKEVLKELILRWEDGQIIPFDAPHFLAWIPDDPALQGYIRKLGQQDASDTLFKYLKLYNQRHPVYLGE